MKNVKHATFGVVAVSIIAASIWFSTQTQAAQPEEVMAKQAVKNYIAAIEDRNISEILKWVKDTRYQSKAQQIEDYNKLFTTSPFDNSKTKIINLQKVNEKLYKVQIEITRKKGGRQDQLELPIVKDEDNRWKLLVTGVETRE